ncbi:hypothetical protein [Vibrio aestuarianus]|uniref:hypothetical protein n=1 Tax=Vibrio aestuarianus TaxID=28171 RepID=UPI00237C7D74|nr:hypothetical protein [Vibrio aestuarianus]MDE1335110.1 hypothetical protein [Vibrio aestuarianus]
MKEDGFIISNTNKEKIITSKLLLAESIALKENKENSADNIKNTLKDGLYNAM